MNTREPLKCILRFIATLEAIQDAWEESATPYPQKEDSYGAGLLRWSKLNSKRNPTPVRLGTGNIQKITLPRRTPSSDVHSILQSLV